MEDETGDVTKYDVLFTFDNEETSKSYIVFTDNACDEEGNVMIYASVYEPDGESGQLLPIETEKEWRVIEIIIEEIKAEIERKQLNENG